MTYDSTRKPACPSQGTKKKDKKEEESKKAKAESSKDNGKVVDDAAKEKPVEAASQQIEQQQAEGTAKEDVTKPDPAKGEKGAAAPKASLGNAVRLAVMGGAKPQDKESEPKSAKGRKGPKKDDAQKDEKKPQRKRKTAPKGAEDQEDPKSRKTSEAAEKQDEKEEEAKPSRKRRATAKSKPSKEVEKEDQSKDEPSSKKVKIQEEPKIIKDTEQLGAEGLADVAEKPARRKPALRKKDKQPKATETKEEGKETCERKEDKKNETAVEKEDKKNETAVEKEDKKNETAGEKEDKKNETAGEKEDTKNETAGEKEDKKNETAGEEEDKKNETAGENKKDTWDSFVHWGSKFLNNLTTFHFPKLYCVSAAHLRIQCVIMLSLVLTWQEKKKSGAFGLVGMREIYWNHIKEAKDRLAKENPDMSAHEILGKAREEHGTKLLQNIAKPCCKRLHFNYISIIYRQSTKKYVVINYGYPVRIAIAVSPRWQKHPERLNNMKNLSSSELSRRRLVPVKNPKSKAKAEPTKPQTSDTVAENSEAVEEPKPSSWFESQRFILDHFGSLWGFATSRGYVKMLAMWYRTWNKEIVNGRFYLRITCLCWLVSMLPFLVAD